MHAPAAVSEETPTLYALARDAIDSSDNDVNRAVDALVSRLSRDEPLLRSISRAAVAAAVRDSANSILA